MLYLIRHGQTRLNRAHVLQGRSDAPLDETGVEQARAAARRLASVRFARVFSSPLVRAVRTAEIVAPGIAPELDGRLLEMDYGPYEGADLENPPPELAAFFRDLIHRRPPEGMESLESVVRRTGSFLEEVRELPGDILISTHAIAMKGALEYLTPDARGAYWGKYLPNCGVYTVENRGGELGIPREFA